MTEKSGALIPIDRPYSTDYTGATMTFMKPYVFTFLFTLSMIHGGVPALAQEESSSSFWWGVSTAPYQIEDQTQGFRTDWDAYRRHFPWKIPDKKNGTFGFTEFERDLQAMKSLGITHYRFGIEWARLEPSPGDVNLPALEHYVHMAKRLREEGIEPIVCLWHFTFPKWLIGLPLIGPHGWLHHDFRERWRSYVALVTLRLKPYVNLYAPQNEPNTQSLAAFMGGEFPPFHVGDVLGYELNNKASAEAFRDAADLIHKIHPAAKVMSIQNMVEWKRDPLDLLGLIYDSALKFNFDHLDRIQDVIDIVGFNYYFSERAALGVPLELPLRHGPDFSDMGWPIDPQGLQSVSRALFQRYRKPLVILENGIADHSDLKRVKYLTEHLQAIDQLRAERIPILGYFHWTLVDNYEWAKGYTQEFGLYSLDLETRKIREKPSAAVYRRWIENHLLKN